jgi:hypothetical protein
VSALLLLWSRVPAAAKRIGVYLLGSLALFALGVAVGRFATPPKVVTKTEIQEKVVTKVVRVKVRDVARHTTTVTTTTPTPLGPSTRTETHTDTESTTRTDTKSDGSVNASVLTTKTVDPYKPQWRVGAMGGALLVPGAAPTWLVGPSVERRVAGPIWAGAWGMGGPGGGAVGLQLHVEF